MVLVAFLESALGPEHFPEDVKQSWIKALDVVVSVVATGLPQRSPDATGSGMWNDKKVLLMLLLRHFYSCLFLVTPNKEIPFKISSRIKYYLYIHYNPSWIERHQHRRLSFSPFETNCSWRVYSSIIIYVHFLYYKISNCLLCHIFHFLTIMLLNCFGVGRAAAWIVSLFDRSPHPLSPFWLAIHIVQLKVEYIHMTLSVCNSLKHKILHHWVLNSLNPLISSIFVNVIYF